MTIHLSLPLTVTYIHTHISQRAHPASHQIPLCHSHSQAQVRDANVSLGEQIPKNQLNWFQVFAVMTYFSFYKSIPLFCPSSFELSCSWNKNINHVKAVQHSIQTSYLQLPRYAKHLSLLMCCQTGSNRA